MEIINNSKFTVGDFLDITSNHKWNVNLKECLIDNEPGKMFLSHITILHNATTDALVERLHDEGIMVIPSACSYTQSYLCHAVFAIVKDRWVHEDDDNKNSDGNILDGFAKTECTLCVTYGKDSNDEIFSSIVLINCNFTIVDVKNNIDFIIKLMDPLIKSEFDENVVGEHRMLDCSQFV